MIISSHGPCAWQGKCAMPMVLSIHAAKCKALTYYCLCDYIVINVLYIIDRVNTGMFPVGDTSSGTLIAVCVCVCVCVCQSVCQSVCPPTYRYIAPRMIQRIILKLCGYVGCDDATNVSNFGYEPMKFSSLKLIK